MAEVFIESLTVENFGPYYGTHSLSFDCSDERCGILIGGKNGAGKTHLLRALYLAVVGEAGVGDLKRVEQGSDATRFAFDRSLNRRALSEGKDTVRLSVNLLQRDTQSGASRKAEITREIRFRPNSAPVWTSYATRSEGNGVITDEFVIHKLRDAFLPRHLARFFFFDAERGQSLNLGQQDIVEGITRILGLWSYYELEADLRQLINSKIPKVFNSSMASEAERRLADINSEIIKIEGHLGADRRALGEVELALSEKESELAEVEDELKALGAVDPEVLSDFTQRKAEASAARGKIEERLTEAWEYAIPLGLLGNLRIELAGELVREEKRRDWEGSRAAVQPKIPQIKADVFDGVEPEFALAPDLHAFYSDRLERALRSLFNPPPEGMAEKIYLVERNDISAQVRDRLTRHSGSLAELADLCTEAERLDAELRELDQKIRSLQQNASALSRGGELHQRRGGLNSEISSLTQRKAELLANIEQHEGRLAELRREETNQRALFDKASEGQGLISRAHRYREAVAEIRNRAAVQLRDRISEHVGELWVQIADRGEEFVGMEFDSHWNCFLKKHDNSKVSWEETNTSAGQRQVRMLAFYEALRRLARLVPPLVVDTPLARLDKAVRANVLDHLYLSGHQSIILSTDSEIDADSIAFDSIESRIARVYTLHPEGNPSSQDYQVRISEDYFGRTV
jgi:hypothetical protein